MKVYKKLGIPKEDLPETIHSTKRFWVSKIPKRWVDRIFTEIFWLFQKIGKNSYKNAGIVLGYPSIFRKQIFYPKKFVYNCLLVLQGFTKKLPKN
jgi:hypothetical protein